MQNNLKNFLCMKLHLGICDEKCQRAHNIQELNISLCYNGSNCNNNKCPFVHSQQELLNIDKQQYYERMYNYVKPYDTNKTSVCRYSQIGCRIDKCNKAHNSNEIRFSECECSRHDCVFYHRNRDADISKEEYFARMKDYKNIIIKNKHEMLCRYINIGCQREDCPYAHSIDQLKIHKCIFKECKNTKCIFYHDNNNIDKQEYYNRMLEHIIPLKPKTVICYNNLCNGKNCKHAHSLSEFVVSNCVRGNKCKKHCCPFKHPNDKVDKSVFYNRMLYALHPN